MKGEAKINANAFSSRGHEEQCLKSIELSLRLWFISVDSENMSSIVHMDFFHLYQPFPSDEKGNSQLKKVSPNAQ